MLWPTMGENSETGAVAVVEKGAVHLAHMNMKKILECQHVYVYEYDVNVHMP